MFLGAQATQLVQQAKHIHVTALVLPLTACSLLPLEPPEEPTERTPSPGMTNGPTGDPSDYVASCTDEGRPQTLRTWRACAWLTLRSSTSGR